MLKMGGARDHYKIGAWLNKEEILDDKDSEGLRRRWWIYAVICIFLQGFLFVRSFFKQLKQLFSKETYKDETHNEQYKKIVNDPLAQFDQALAVLFTVVLQSKSVKHKLTLLFSRHSENISKPMRAMLLSQVTISLLLPVVAFVSIS